MNYETLFTGRYVRTISGDFVEILLALNPDPK
jgi:hypothetical protein